MMQSKKTNNKHSANNKPTNNKPTNNLTKNNVNKLTTSAGQPNTRRVVIAGKVKYLPIIQKNNMVIDNPLNVKKMHNSNMVIDNPSNVKKMHNDKMMHNNKIKMLDKNKSMLDKKNKPILDNKDKSMLNKKNKPILDKKNKSILDSDIQILDNDVLDNDVINNDVLDNDVLDNDTLDNDTLDNDILDNQIDEYNNNAKTHNHRIGLVKGKMHKATDTRRLPPSIAKKVNELANAVASSSTRSSEKNQQFAPSAKKTSGLTNKIPSKYAQQIENNVRKQTIKNIKCFSDLRRLKAIQDIDPSSNVDHNKASIQELRKLKVEQRKQNQIDAKKRAESNKKESAIQEILRDEKRSKLSKALAIKKLSINSRHKNKNNQVGEILI